MQIEMTKEEFAPLMAKLLNEMSPALALGYEVMDVKFEGYSNKVTLTLFPIPKPITPILPPPDDSPF